MEGSHLETDGEETVVGSATSAGSTSRMTAVLTIDFTDAGKCADRFPKERPSSIHSPLCLFRTCAQQSVTR